MYNGLTKEEASDCCSDESFFVKMNDKWDANEQKRKEEFDMALKDIKSDSIANGDIVAYGNDMNYLNKIGSLSATSQNIFYYCLSQVYEKGNDIVEIPISKLKDILGLQRQRQAVVYEAISNIRYNLKDIEFHYNDGEREIWCYPFYYFELKDDIFKIAIANRWLKLLNNLFDKTGKLLTPYTSLDFHEFMEIKSKHSKTLYTLLSQWQYNGKTEGYSIEFLKFRMGTENYADRDYKNKILYPSFIECSKYFKDLKAHRSEDGKIYFTFKKRPKEQHKLVKQNKKKKDGAMKLEVLEDWE